MQEQHGEKRAAYGEAILKELSIALMSEFGKGFSYPNLRNFRQFYLTYPSENEICYALSSKLSWTQHRLIMRVSDEGARKFYIKESAERGWSSRQLERNINSSYYQRILSNQSLESGVKEIPVVEEYLKDPYVFEFLNIAEPLSGHEKTVEPALIDNLQKFLLELGKGFSFIGRQYRISTETTHYYVDLVFYNYILTCFVLFDLKTSKLAHQDIGQMDMYRRMFDDFKRPEGDNPTIGIILCAEKDETVVKYSVLNDDRQLFVSKFLPYLPTEEELIMEIEREKQLLGLSLEGRK